MTCEILVRDYFLGGHNIRTKWNNGIGQLSFFSFINFTNFLLKSFHFFSPFRGHRTSFHGHLCIITTETIVLCILSVNFLNFGIRQSPGLSSRNLAVPAGSGARATSTAKPDLVFSTYFFIRYMAQPILCFYCRAGKKDRRGIK
jgi:hypothetical protein